ncbi:MAG TPA: flagellar hook-associated protein FlgK [Chloroflexota bacterium]|jgi:flagellar hook-associated protein 1 FlgK|nr:flagellar hook-associated protein FlgK [Chloroflexota bacterium]
MTSAWFGLDIATRGLRAAQTLVDIANQNVANANTPGYSRQAADVRATLPYPIPTFTAGGIPGQLGTGVEVADIRRARDTFVDYQIRGQLTSQGRWDARRDALRQVEAVVNEPSTNGLSSLMTKYWQAWQEVANSPSDTAVRASLIEQGKSLADAFQNASKQFIQQQRDLDQQVRLTVTDINSYADQIAQINLQISQVETAGMHANDLRDQRDQLLDKLSQLVKINYVESSEGSVSVYVGNRQLVDRDKSYAMQTGVPAGAQFNQVQWAADGQPVNLQDGKLEGLLEARDSLLQTRLDDLNTLAGRIIESVNTVHAAGAGLDGMGGVKFFNGTDASNMTVDPLLTGANGTDHIAAARAFVVSNPPASATYSAAKGDSSNAIALAELANAVSQRDTSLDPAATVLWPGNSIGSATVLGIDLSRAPGGTAYAFSGVSFDPVTSTASINTGSTAVSGTVTSNLDASDPTQQIVSFDAGTFRIVLRGSAASTVASILANLNGTAAGTTAAPSTIGDQYGQQVAALGVASRSAANQSTNQQVLVTQLQRQRDQTSGVSLDEETTHLIQYQHAYQAAARVISVVDQMLDTLINNTGVVGR